MTSTPALRAFFTAGTIAFVSLGVIKIALAPPEIMFSMAVTWVALSPSNLPAPVISVAPFFFAAFWAPSFIFTKKGFTSVLVMSPTTTWSALYAGNAAQSRESRRRIFTFMFGCLRRRAITLRTSRGASPRPHRRWDKRHPAWAIEAPARLPEEIARSPGKPSILTRRARPIRVRRSEKPERRTQDASLSVCSCRSCRSPGRRRADAGRALRQGAGGHAEHLQAAAAGRGRGERPREFHLRARQSGAALRARSLRRDERSRAPL